MTEQTDMHDFLGKLVQCQCLDDDFTFLSIDLELPNSHIKKNILQDNSLIYMYLKILFG